MRYLNPFKPTAGKTPPILVGREGVIGDFMEGLENGPGAPGRLMRITGPRGSGKTVLLSELAGIAAKQGWLVVNVTGREGLCESIREQLEHRARLQGFSIKAELPILAVEATGTVSEPPSFRRRFEEVTRLLSERGKGVLITIDEVQDAPADEMRTVAENVQFMIREDQNIALVFAGITTGVLDILNGKAMTFLRRAKAEELQLIPLDEVGASLRETVEQSGLCIDDDALEVATSATAGYAYLIQLVGYHIWRTAWQRCRNGEGDIVITVQDAERGAVLAREEFAQAVHEPAISGLSKPAVDFLLAMAEGPEVMATADIAAHMGKTTSYLSAYRRKLIERQVIEQTAPGYVTFSIPFMREFLLGNKQEILARYGV